MRAVMATILQFLRCLPMWAALLGEHTIAYTLDKPPMAADLTSCAFTSRASRHKAGGAVPSIRIYASSNGDTWDLVKVGEQLTVLHTPNVASGGRPMCMELGAFLACEPHTAQNVALVSMIGTLLDGAANGAQESKQSSDSEAERKEDAMAQAAGLDTPE